jgi:acyl-ACP thioesterase
VTAARLRFPELTAWSRGRRFSARRPVRLADVAPSGTVRLDAIARWLQDVAADDLLDSGLEGRSDWVVRRTAIVPHRPAVARSFASLSTWCAATGPCWAERRTTIQSDLGARVEASSLWVSLDPDTHRPAVLEQRFVDLYAPSAAGRKVTSRLWIAGQPPAGAGPARPWALRSTDFDALGHVNNAATWQAVEDELHRIAPGREVRWAVLEYRAALAPGSSVSMVTESLDDQVVIWLEVADQIVSAAQVCLRAEGVATGCADDSG